MFQSGNFLQSARNLIDTGSGRENHSALLELFLNLDLKSPPPSRLKSPAPYN
jgi:hypothetical protein